ncbi:MAG: hypothetical protein ACYDC7_11470, partial [Acidithiobacillus ferrivorans]
YSTGNEMQGKKIIIREKSEQIYPTILDHAPKHIEEMEICLTIIKITSPLFYKSDGQLNTA